MIEVLTDNHYQAIRQQFSQAAKSIRIISPLLTGSMAELLCEAAAQKRLACTFITRFYINDMFHRANSVDALEKMLQAGIAVYAVKGLHTKLYLFDEDAAILGSANFTSGGLKTNIELSLLITQETAILGSLHNYWEEFLAQIEPCPDAPVTPAMIKDARKLLESLWKSNKGAVPTESIRMYGAALGRSAGFTTSEAQAEIQKTAAESDAVYDLFRENEVVSEVKYPHTIWLKFDGDAEERIGADESFPMVRVELEGRQVYLQNYPRRPMSVKEGDEVYLAAITTDAAGKNQPVIMGRGHLCGFAAGNHVTDEWVREYDWMEKYPWYCVVLDCEVLKTACGNGIPLDSILQKLGSDTYLVSFGRNESVQAVAQKHYQKAHIRLSGNAKQEIDRQFDKLKQAYGAIPYASEIQALP